MKRFFTILMCLFTAINVTLTAQTYSGGSGNSETDPYLISSKADMEALATAVNDGNNYSGKYFLLTQNITEAVTTIIGGGSGVVAIPFSGTFDGNGYKINVQITTGTNYYVGIFGYLKSATIKNLGVTGSIRFFASIDNSTYYVGGICGKASVSTISNCYNTAEISASSRYSAAYVGGICGYAYDTSSITIITNCYNTGNVSANSISTNVNVGGISGMSGNILNCYNTGNISAGGGNLGTAKAGGICGEGAWHTTITNCLAANATITSTRSSNSLTRRIVSQYDNAVSTINNCYALSTMLLNGSIRSVWNSADGRDWNMNNLQDPLWFKTNLLWDFDNIWNIPENGQFPLLKIQRPANQPTSISLTIPTILYGDQTTLNATTNNNVAVITYTSSNSTIAEISGNILTAKKAGSITITASQPEGNGFFAGTTSVELTIGKRNLQVIANNAIRFYGESNPTFTFFYSGFVNGDNDSQITIKPTITTTATLTSNVGDYPIICSEGSATNYNLSYLNGKFTIIKALLTVNVNSANRYYGSENPTFTINYSGFCNAETQSVLIVQPQIICLATSTSNVGDYPISLSGGTATNYELYYYNGTLSVTKASLTITAENKQRKQGEANPPFTLLYSGFKNNENQSVLNVLPTISCAANINSLAGLYDIVLSGGSDNNYNYNLINGKLEVTAANNLVEVTISEVSLFPIPAKDYIFIESDSPLEKVEIYNQSGICVLRNENVTDKLDVSSLANGFYLARIYVNDKTVTKKIVIKK